MSPGHRQEHGRRSRPALGLAAEPHGEYGQQRPTEGKRQQHHTGKDVLLRRDEGGGDHG